MWNFITAGESHGRALTAIIEGLPAGLAVSMAAINSELKRRQQGYGRGGRMKIESDTAEILSGVRFGQTLGSPLTLQIKNRDWDNWLDRMSPDGPPTGDKVTAVRPGHADLVGVKKYDRADVRDILERASARETAARVAVGAVAKQLLGACGIEVVSHVTNIGGVAIDRSNVDFNKLSDKSISQLNCYDAAAEPRMIAAITEARAQGDTLGGIFEVVIRGAVVGLGSHTQWNRRLDAKLAAAMMSIQAIKGVEIGEGFGYAALPGSKAHDEIFITADKRPYRKTNHAGGIEGGMSNGENIVIRAVMKPIPTLMRPLASIDIESGREVTANTERSDVCAVSAASVVGEAMAAITVADALLNDFGGSNMTDLQRFMDSYAERING